MNKEIICIACPTGCKMNIAKSVDNTWVVTGNKCPRGKKYGIEEITEPKRIVTYVVKTNSKETPFVSVKSDKPLLKDLIPNLLNELSKKRVKIPIKCGDIVIKNYINSGINILFTRTIKSQNE